MKLKGRGVYFQLLNAPKYYLTTGKKKWGEKKNKKIHTPSKKQITRKKTSIYSKIYR